MIKLQGVFPPIATPFDSAGNLYRAKILHNIGRLNQVGLSGYVVAGSTGESPLLSFDERIQLFEHVREAPGALIRFVLINVLLAVFNMIPIPPLDGGNVLIGILPQQMAAGVEQLRSWGFVLLYVLMLSGFLSSITFPVQRSILNWLL